MNKLPETFYFLQLKVTLSHNKTCSFLEIVCNAAGLIKCLSSNTEAKSMINTIEVYSFLCNNEASITEEIPAPIFEDLAEDFLEIMRKEELLNKTKVHYMSEKNT